MLVIKVIHSADQEMDGTICHKSANA